MDLSTVQNTVACWWYNYDEAAFDVWPTLVTDDIVFTCRSDVGNTSYEEFIRADVRGRGAFLAWQRDHRSNSPYPLRHNGTNVHLTGTTEAGADFMSYIFVTQIVDGKVSNLSSGSCSGTVRIEDDVPRLAALHVVLDTQESVVLSTRQVGVGTH